MIDAWIGLRRRSLRLLAAVAALAACSLLAVPAAGAHAPKRSPWSFGAFAGYVWKGPVTSVAASWTVAHILPRSPLGVAGTWIGAQAPGIRDAFIQVGTNEVGFGPSRRGKGESSDEAFWSDIAHGYHPVGLFSVREGDRISANLVLQNGEWSLSVADDSSGRTVSFSTHEEANATFNQAEWLQEDPVDARTHKPIAYPRLSTVGFQGLTVNSAAPTYSQVLSQWMSENGEQLAPTPLRDDSFTLHPASVTRFGARYLKLAGPEDAATNLFVAKMTAWTETTPARQMSLARDKFANALRGNIQAFSQVRWPKAARELIAVLVGKTRVLLSQSTSALPTSASGLTLWRSTWTQDAEAVGTAASAAKRALDLPQLRPTP